ncbi:MAG TPA: metal-dependent transcriptional regulator [Cytophagales bacterium]|nr:metal-dependent transcriptional regulator [Cytophagales bacterium]
MLTLTEENYIKCIYKLSNNGTRSVSTNEIAEKLETKPASVSDMLRKLAAKELLGYEKYYGVTLKNEGVAYACKIIRKHRLWEVFLVEKLNFKWDEVHEVAEQLEHVKSNLLIERLDAFLGFPKQDPHGGYIPDQDGKWSHDNAFPLSEGEVTDTYILVRVEGNSELLKHLNAMNVQIGTKIKIEKRREFDNLLEIIIDNQRREVVSNNFGACLLVKKYEG